MWEDIFIFVASSQENDSQVLGFFLELFVIGDYLPISQHLAVY